MYTYIPEMENKNAKQPHIDVEDNGDPFADNSLVVHEQPTQTYRRSAKTAIFDDSTEIVTYRSLQSIVQYS